MYATVSNAGVRLYRIKMAQERESAERQKDLQQNHGQNVHGIYCTDLKPAL